MPRLLLIGFLLWIPLFSYAEGPEDQIESLMKVPPQTAAERAFGSGDVRFLLATDCNEMLYGYPVNSNATYAPTGKDKAKLAGPSCKDLLGAKLSDQVLRLRQYTTTYNQHLYKLIEKRSAKK